MIAMDNTTTIEVIEHFLREQQGWRPFGGLFKRHRNNPRIYARAGKNIVLIGPYKVKPDILLDPAHARHLQDDFEDYLHQVQRELQNHIAAMQPKALTLVFSRGGSLQIPQWFLDWCQQMGIVVVFAPDPQEHPGEDNVLEYILMLRRMLEELEFSECTLNHDWF